jgi:hypothetical protein
MRNSAQGDGEAFARFEARVLADAGLQQALAEPRADAEFVAAAAAAARGLGIDLSDAAVADRIARDPLGLWRLATPPTLHDAPPPGDWLPTALAEQPNGALRVEWCHFAGARLDDPFFAVSILAAQARPFNRAFRIATPLTAASGGRRPDGLVFHQSRCGSTVLARMLGALPRATAFSEPAPVDAVVHLAATGWLDEDEAVEALRAIVGACGRRAAAEGGPLFVKLDAWHSLSLPLFRAAFPGTPWLFLFREPVEILVSQIRSRGHQTVPQLMDPAHFGVAREDAAPGEDYCARVLARIGDAALGHAAIGGGLFVDYADFPDAVADRIMPHFALPADDASRRAIAAAAMRDAKSPEQVFAADAEGKGAEAGEAVREAADRHMRPVYDALRAAAAGAQA